MRQTTSSKGADRGRCAALMAMAFLLLAGGYAAEKRVGEPPTLRIFDGQPKMIVVNGYSMSFRWPVLLQEKLDRYFEGEHVVTVEAATKGGTPIAKWIDVETGEPREPWLKILRPKLKERGETPVIVLGQQSLQWAFGDRSAGIEGPADAERIEQGTDALEKYVRLLRADGADLVFVAMHVYKKLMEPQTGNERLVLDALMEREIDGVEPGPDVWTPTKQRYPEAFARDKLHPNQLGAEIMAQAWFETLLSYDGLEVPTWSRSATGDLGQPRRPARQPRGRVPTHRDIAYVPEGHERQKLDLYLPEERGAEPLPLIIWVHGGAWRAGNKAGCPARRFVERGYAVASINYRLSQHAIFPAQIQDCKAAVRWLRANAGTYNLDPTRFGVWGSSAGGHLVALLGTAGDVKKFDVGENLGVSSRVQAVCDFFGPTDFTKMSSFPSRMDHDAPDSPESRLIGGAVQENGDKVRRADPITYVTRDDPPFLIVHGDKDPLVPHNQSELLRDALKKVDVPVRLYTVEGGGHGGFKDPKVDPLVAEFFAKHLAD